MRRPLLMFSAVLLIGAVVASVQGPALPIGFTLSRGVMLWVAGVGIAAVLLAPFALVRRARPLPREVGAALAVAVLVVYPVAAAFDNGARRDEEPDCYGVVPLPEAVQNAVADDVYVRFDLPLSCLD